jgi:glutamate/tyrosine decarboxylase-like PLP-dependent enzyme
MKPLISKPETINQLIEDLLAQADPTERLTADCQALLSEAEQHQLPDRAAHMTGNLAPYSLLGQHMATLHQGNLLSAELYPQLKQAEASVLDWLKPHFLKPYASFTHGGTYSNLEALWMARDSSPESHKIVYGSRACHYSIKKACDILGLEFVAIETNNLDQIDPAKLKQACERLAPVAIMANLGSSAAGSIDDLEACTALASEFKCWLHIDAAWGGAMAMLPENRERFQLLKLADSISFDPHKSLFQPRPCSMLLSNLPNATTNGDIDYLERTPELHIAGSNGGELFLPLWLNLNLLGEDWFYQKTRHRLAQARKFVMQLTELTKVRVISSETGIVCFAAPASEELDKLVTKGILSKAKVNHQPVYRAVFAGFQTKANELIKVIRPYL